MSKRLIWAKCDDVIIVNDKELYKKSLKKYCVALPCFPQQKDFCCKTILVSALDTDDARERAIHLTGAMYTGSVKEINY